MVALREVYCSLLLLGGVRDVRDVRDDVLASPTSLYHHTNPNISCLSFGFLENKQLRWWREKSVLPYHKFINLYDLYINIIIMCPHKMQEHKSNKT